jgi:hypothetical protein
VPASSGGKERGGWGGGGEGGGVGWGGGEGTPGRVGPVFHTD